MKKKIYTGLIAAVLALTLCLVFVLAGCGGSKSYTVTFVISSGNEETVTVDDGDTVDAPDDPTQSGYMFTGWYSDSACENLFDFSTVIKEDTTVYAGWMEHKDGYVYVTYMYNYEGAGTLAVQEFEMKSSAGVNISSDLLTSEDATREGYLFGGWFTDSALTTAFDSTQRVAEDITLYASWLQGFTFEAEDTSLTYASGSDRQFHGYSVNLVGSQAVQSDTEGSTATNTASNGYYIAAMNYDGEYVEFTINSDAAVTNATLYVSMAFEYGYSSPITLTSSDLTISVNSTAVSYNSITCDISSLSNAGDHTTFQSYYIGNISLVSGSNTIKIETTNSIKGQGGTQDGVGPLIDCITVYSSSTLSMTKVSNY